MKERFGYVKKIIKYIFFDTILGQNNEINDNPETKSGKYDTIGEYKVKDYKERPHKYTEE